MRSNAIPLLVVGLVALAPATAAPPALTGGEALSVVYRQILDGDSDLDAEMRAARVDAPPEACRVLAATGIWWQIMLDPTSRALDDQFLFVVNSAIDGAEAWVAREPGRAEAWFYLGGAYGARVQWRVLRAERLAAARDGKRIKDALDRALQLNPMLDDAFFGLGLYQYYAAVAPAPARILRFLLFLPGGDRRQGLENLLRARERGTLIRGEADYQLAIIYLWYEKRPERALELLEELRKTYPRNPVFARHLAEVQDTYFHDVTASLNTYRALLAAAQRGRVNAAAIAVADARLGIARQLDALHQTDRTIEELKPLIEQKAVVPYAALARAHLQTGAAYDRLGERAAATAEYRAAIAAATPEDWYGVRTAAAAALRKAPDASTTEAYRLSLTGWRLLERQQLDQADTALTRSLALKPGDPVTRFRYGRLLLARKRPGSDAAALTEFRRVIARGTLAPPPIIAAACLDAGSLLEQSGARDEAVTMYARAAHMQGSASDTRASASRALARLSTPPP